MNSQPATTLRSLLAAAPAHPAGGVAAAALPDPGLLDAAAAQTQISSLAYDSRSVQPGSLFFCVPGFSSDGHDFAGSAVAAGAVALVTERALGSGAIEIVVPSVRAAMGPIASAFNGEPSRRLELIGVTGTNGKTTTAMLVRALQEALGGSCGLLGTVQSVIAGRAAPAQRTTPEAIDLQAQLYAMAQGGDRACAMEVSSHALALHRSDGCSFACAIFTNLTQDHLDFHADMEDYFAAKRRLFEGQVGRCVINVGDPYGRRLASELPDAVSFALEGEAAGADFYAEQIECAGLHSAFTLVHPGGTERVDLAMAGRYNIENALAALAAVATEGRPIAPLLERLAEGVQVPGRLEPVDCAQQFSVLIDYAHTPDSLERVLSAARELLAPGARLHCVFGAGGDRDRAKRPLMGRAAARLADQVIVTSDNPRSESPEAIIDEIVAGMQEADARAAVRAIIDRREAIAAALAQARAADVVLIAGKGHERGQEFADGLMLPFDDVAVAREELAALGHTAGSDRHPPAEHATTLQMSSAHAASATASPERT